MDYQDKFFEGNSIEDAKRNAIDELGQKRILEFVVYSDREEYKWQGEGKTLEDAIWNGKKWFDLNPETNSLQISPTKIVSFASGKCLSALPETIQKAESGTFHTMAYTSDEAQGLFSNSISAYVLHHEVECITAPTNGFMGIGKKAGTWRVNWDKPCVVRLTFIRPAVVKVRYRDEPADTITSETDKVIFAREYQDYKTVQIDSQTSTTVTFTYKVYRAESRNIAISFLENSLVETSYSHLIVQTPEGNYYRDINGIHEGDGK